VGALLGRVGSGDMLSISQLPWRFAGLGAGFAGTEGAAEAGLQPFDEGAVAEGAAGALVATEAVDLVLVGEERPLPTVAPLGHVMGGRRERRRVPIVPCASIYRSPEPRSIELSVAITFSGSLLIVAAIRGEAKPIRSATFEPPFKVRNERQSRRTSGQGVGPKSTRNGRLSVARSLDFAGISGRSRNCLARLLAKLVAQNDPDSVFQRLVSIDIIVRVHEVIVHLKRLNRAKS